ncbi:hypothetical protein POK33_29290 [Burkholderia cenocepacia]|uniref:hypothetical protein n=1 Tax=Burkholderia cenocepacia TaxID=95486 RepID=UPI0023B99FAD|nr:hypothetical protein [Burkholderia cenocepacia]MDF0504833.1 hypothetical protein [Burkholderia cenocepacia]
MQAITTKFIGPTDTKGARIKASCDAGSITISYPHAFSEEACHALAAMALVRKLGWVPTDPKTGEHQNGYVGAWAAGSVRTGYVFAFAFGVQARPMWSLFDHEFGA